MSAVGCGRRGGCLPGGVRPATRRLCCGVAPVRAVSGDGGDGERRFAGEALGMTVANAQFIGVGFNIAPRASLADGLLDVQVFTARRREVFRFGDESPHRLAPVRPGGAPLFSPRGADRRGRRRMAGGSGRGGAGHGPGGVPSSAGPAVIKNLIHRRGRRCKAL